MKDTIEITITREDAEKEKGFIDTDNCLLATAVKRYFPNAKIIYAGTHTFFVDDVRYETSNFNIGNLYTNSCDKVLINKLPVTFTATKV